MHVRLFVRNGSEESWTVDTREQIGVLAGEQSRPAFAAASAGQAPVVTVAPGSGVLFDLYYPLPRGREGTGEVLSFDVLWSVELPGERVAARSSFDRVAVETLHAPAAGWSYGWSGAPGWYDPFWPEYTFEGASVPPSR
jgi:hypothetical protein